MTSDRETLDEMTLDKMTLGQMKCFKHELVLPSIANFTDSVCPAKNRKLTKTSKKSL